jgi:hypothetical protein
MRRLTAAARLRAVEGVEFGRHGRLRRRQRGGGAGGLAQLVHPGQHLGDGGKQHLGHFLVDLGVGVERARQRRRLEHRHLVLGGQVADLQRQQVGALGHHLGGGHGLLVVLERHRIVGRVHHHQVGLGHGGQHAAARQLAHARLDLALDLDVALDLLELFLDFLVAHLQLLAQAPLLQRHVDDREGAQGQQHQHQAAAQQLAGAGQRPGQRLQHHVGEGLQVGPQVAAADGQQHGGQQAGLERLHQLHLGEDAADAGDRIELAELGLQRLERPVPAAAQLAGRQRRQDHGRAQRQHQRRRLPGQRQQVTQHRITLAQHAGVEDQPAGHQRAQPGHDLRRQAHQQRRADGHGRGMPEVARARDLAVLARLEDLARCRG